MIPRMAKNAVFRMSHLRIWRDAGEEDYARKMERALGRCYERGTKVRGQNAFIACVDALED